MHVVICSLVRNGMRYLPAYRKQLEALSLPEGLSWNLCILEGDSSDGSWNFLCRWASEDDRIIIGRENVGAADEGLDDRAERWARAGNACLDLRHSVPNYTHVLWLESDLAFPLDLLTRLLSCKVDIVAPMVWIGGQFYDTWGFRDISGRKWSNSPPYHPNYRSNSLMEMGSVGSCVLIRREVLDAGIRVRGPYETGLLVGICNDARSKGFRVFADTSTAILHPVSLWEDQMWRLSGVKISDMRGTVRPLSLEDALSLRAAPLISLLTPEALVYAHRWFLKNVFKIWKTNRIDLRVEKELFPSRRYYLTVVIEKPEGLGRYPKVLKFFLSILSLERVKPFICDGWVYLEAGLISRFIKFACNVSIDKEQ